jgi:hypothetical protein
VRFVDIECHVKVHWSALRDALTPESTKQWRRFQQAVGRWEERMAAFDCEMELRQRVAAGEDLTFAESMTLSMRTMERDMAATLRAQILGTKPIRRGWFTGIGSKGQL